MERNIKFCTFYLFIFFIFSLTVNNSLSLAEILSVSLSLSYSLEENTENYLRFLEEFRNSLAGPTISNEIPVLRESAAGESKYIYVNITNFRSQKVTFGISVINCYVLAFKAEGNNKKSYFFNDPSHLDDAKKYLFPGTTPTTIPWLTGLIPGDDIILRENNWEDLSTAIQDADDDKFLRKVNKNNEFERITIDLGNRKITKVEDALLDIKLLLYAPPVPNIVDNRLL